MDSTPKKTGMVVITVLISLLVISFGSKALMSTNGKKASSPLWYYKKIKFGEVYDMSPGYTGHVKSMGVMMTDPPTFVFSFYHGSYGAEPIQFIGPNQKMLTRPININHSFRFFTLEVIEYDLVNGTVTIELWEVQ